MRATGGRRAFALAAAVCVLAGLACDNGAIAERDTLRQQVKALQDTVAELRATPAARLAAARAAEDVGRHEEAEKGYQTLISQYATSSEAAVAKVRLEAIAAARDAKEAEAMAAAARASREAAAREQALLTGVEKKHDDMQDITWYTPKGTIGFSVPVYLYLGESGTSRWLRLWLGTHTDEWLFWDKVIFNVDGELSTYLADHFQKKTDVITGGGVLEWLDVKLDDMWEARFRRMAEAKSVKVRFEGKYQKDVVLSDATKAKLRLILDLYDRKRGAVTASR